MVKIDSVLSEKADKSVSFDATLSATGWIGIDAPYTQEVLIDGLLADQNGLFSLAQSATAEQRELARSALLCVVGQSDGKLVISADGDLPDLDIPITVIILD